MDDNGSGRLERTCSNRLALTVQAWMTSGFHGGVDSVQSLIVASDVAFWT